MKKTLCISGLVVLLMVAIMIFAPEKAFAYEQGRCGSSVYYELYDDGTRYIYGDGPWDYQTFGSKYVTDAYIFEGVTSINDVAFLNCKSLRSIQLPSTLTTIESSAFDGCSSLENIVLPESLKILEGWAFADCSSLTSVTIPGSVTSIGHHAFRGCSSLTSLTIKNGVKYIEYSAFSGCSSLASVTIPSSVINIEYNAFYSCSSLESVSFQGSISSLGEYAFYKCESLTEITIPEGTKSIGNKAFDGCISLEKVVVLEGVTSIGEWAFYECKSLKSVTIPESVRSIGKYAFRYCDELKRITVPGSVKTIADYAFPSKAYIHCVPGYKYFFDQNVGGYMWIADLTDTMNKTRIAGESRFETALETARRLKTVLDVEKFDTIIVAPSHNFPDALAGSYLAAKESAPILIVRTDKKTEGVDEAVEFISENLSENGKVYILGGNAAVSSEAENDIRTVAANVERIAGDNRYLTNIAILNAAGVEDGDDLLIADAKGFADALSASALGKPILLIDKKTGKLSDVQKQFLEGKSFAKVYIIGGTAAVPDSIKTDLSSCLPGVRIERIAGATRYETSANIAKKFFPRPAAVALATGANFPDGLTGGPLAFSLGAPLVLTRNKGVDIDTSASYVLKSGAEDFVAFGGKSALNWSTIAAVTGQ